MFPGSPRGKRRPLSFFVVNQPRVSCAWDSSSSASVPRHLWPLAQANCSATISRTRADALFPVAKMALPRRRCQWLVLHPRRACQRNPAQVVYPFQCRPLCCLLRDEATHLDRTYYECEYRVHLAPIRGLRPPAFARPFPLPVHDRSLSASLGRATKEPAWPTRLHCTTYSVLRRSSCIHGSHDSVSWNRHHSGHCLRRVQHWPVRDLMDEALRVQCGTIQTARVRDDAHDAVGKKKNCLTPSEENFFASPLRGFDQHPSGSATE